MSINVVNRRGEPVSLRLETISDRLKELAAMPPALSVSTDTVAVKTVAALVDGISSSKIDEISAGICASLIIDDCEYDDLAARIVISDLHKNTTADLGAYCESLLSYKYRDATIKILHPKMVAFVTRHQAQLEAALDYAKDYANNYFGAITLIKAYLLAHKYDDSVKTVKERPQQMFLRVAMGINLARISDEGEPIQPGVLADVIRTYRLLADGYYTHATPTLFNAGTVNHTLSSCYLLSIDDNLGNIYSRLTDISNISKFSGGVGIHVSQVRACGSVIASTVGRSEGLVPMMRVYNESTRYVSQGGGKRKGSTAVYLEPWHADVEDAILTQKQQGAPERLCRDLFLALWVPDLFVVRLKEALKSGKDVMWSLMCPNECPGLSDVYGEEFEVLYSRYEREGRYRRQVDIRHLWNLIVATQIETGKPYLMYKDHVNRKCNQKNLGVIKSSNLCVAGDTLVLTSSGYRRIAKIANRLVDVWNGYEWATVRPQQTGTNCVLYRVTLSDGSSLDCTGQHKFYVLTDSTEGDPDRLAECPALKLKVGDRLERAHRLPVVPGRRSESASDDYGIPFSATVEKRLKWLVAQLDESAVFMQVTAGNLEWLRLVKMLATTLGVESFVVPSAVGYHLRFSSHAVAALVGLGLPLDTASFASVDAPPDLCVESVARIDGAFDTFCFTEHKRHRGMFNGVLTGQCAEITIYSDTENVGVCNLASVCLPKFVKSSPAPDTDRHFNFTHFAQVVREVVVNMNKVIDNNKYPLEQARHSDARARPIGIGVQGLSEVFMILKLPYDSAPAMALNRKIFETMYFAALQSSNQLARELGAYEMFASSPAALGVLQFDMWDVAPSEALDWPRLKQDIQRDGLRNSLLLAQMPTAGTSIIAGHTESIEVPQSNLYTRSTLSGRFQVVNRHLVEDLRALGLWTRDVRRKIIEGDGSVQDIEEIPADLREVYKTIYEYRISNLLKMDAARGAFVCQSLSSNRYLPTPDMTTLTNLHLYAWKLGIKTSSYYVRSKQASTGKKLIDEEEGCVGCSA